MTLVRWRPVREMGELQTQMDRLVPRIPVVNRNNSASTNGLMGTWVMPVDITERDEGITLRAALPGVSPADIDIEVENDVLILRASRQFRDEGSDSGRHWVEQSYGNFTRSLALPKYADVERIDATYEHGVLELFVPKRESAKARKIDLRLVSRPESQTVDSPSGQAQTSAA